MPDFFMKANFWTNGDYLLSPAYDLINTRLHVDDSDFAFDKGLFSDGYQSLSYKKTGHASATDFIQFGKRIGVNEKRLEKLLLPFLTKQEKVETLISHSFLNEGSKRAYQLQYNTKRNYLIS
jgi:serine/threonine-protein kinase HipA